MGPVLLHPGFHKTGTSSLQRGAIALRSVLEPHLRVLLAPDLGDTTRLARRFSAFGEARALSRFHDAFSVAMDALDANDPRPVLISAEDLSGWLPGTHGVTDYSAAAPLVSEAAAVLKSAFGPRCTLYLLYTTRPADDWLRSAYWQVLRATRLTQDFAAFAQTMRQAACFEPVITAARSAVGDAMRVETLALESCAEDPLGPLGYAARRLGVPVTGLPPVPVQNVQPDGAAEAFLALNRSDLGTTDLSDAKRRLLRRYRSGGTTRRPGPKPKFS